MSYPENPETIVLKNRFYSRGMSEKNLYDYYQKIRGPLIEQVKGRDVMFAILAGLNKPILKRKASGKFIILTPSNYDKIITGRTISVYSTMKYYEDIAIVDIDADNFEQSKQPTLDVYNALNGANFIRDLSIRYTGKTGFHIFCEIVRKTKIDSARLLLEQYLLTKKEVTSQYTIAAKRTKGIPNIDLWASNKKNGAFISLHSLSIIGLRCMKVQPTQLQSFRPEQARIRF